MENPALWTPAHRLVDAALERWQLHFADGNIGLSMAAYIVEALREQDFLTAAALGAGGGSEAQEVHVVPTEAVYILGWRDTLAIDMPNWIVVIKTIRKYTGLGLKEAKDITDVVKEGRPAECHVHDANKFTADIRAHGLQTTLARPPGLG